MLRKRPQVLGVELNRSVSAARRLTRWRGSTHKGRPVRNVPRKKQGGHYLHRERAASTEVARQYRKLCSSASERERGARRIHGVGASGSIVGRRSIRSRLMARPLT